ncbi:MAG: hypothetical protein ABI112_05720, partial [Terracoccus sp.]
TSTRDRDRLRPEQLERLGWTHVRVWSTDLFRDPAREISRILGIVRRATATQTAGSALLADPSAIDAGGQAEPSPSVEPAPTALDAADPLESQSSRQPSGEHDDHDAAGDAVADGVDQAVSEDQESPSDDLVKVGNGKAGRTRRRRVFRQGTNPEADAAHYTESADAANAPPDSFVEGEAANETSRERWLEEQRPPHYE